VIRIAYENAEAFGKHWADESREAGRGLIERLPLRDARGVLDLGAGIGVNLPTIRAAAPGAFIVGVDFVEPMIAAALPDFARAAMDAAMLGFADASFDAVLMAFMLFHVPEPPRALAEVHRVLRPGASLAVGTWASDLPDFPASVAWNELLDGFDAEPLEPSVQHHEMMDTQEKLAALLEDAGFDDVDTTTRDLEDAMDLDAFLERRTQLGISSTRFKSLASDARERLLVRAHDILGAMGPQDFVARERAIYAWARRP
jgi:ubiquinone/menaquinone biosynthesis C-methylase UbiE